MIKRNHKPLTEEQREAARIRSRQWYAISNNKEHQLKRQHEYRQANKESIAEYKKKYAQENKERIRKKTKKYTVLHAEEARVRAAAWYKENPKRAKASGEIARHRRRARIAKVGGKFTKEDIRNMYATQGARCYYCSISIEDKYHIDHMNPISRSGSNWIDNICLACVRCNLSKHTKTAKEFMNV